MSLRFIIEEADSGGFIVQEYGKRRSDGETCIGGSKHLFPDWEGVKEFLHELPFKEPEQTGEPIDTK